jgi:hypothetical protein
MATWAIEKRYEFIEFCLFWHGRVNRSDLETTFGISTQQASLDINGYIRLAPENLIYDKSKRTYLRGGSFKPQIQAITSSNYLGQLLAVHADIVKLDQTWLQGLPVFDTTPSPVRAIDAEILRDILEAIKARRGVQIRYQSMSSPTPTLRKIDPHAIACDGYRWHARAFCRKDECFKDFVISRISKIEQVRSAASVPEEDQDWSTTITLKIGPHPELSPAQAKAIAMDYGMQDERLEIKVRKALLFYTLKRLGLDTNPSARQPAEQQITLRNRQQVLAALAEGNL